jgi:hypothetical protein
MYGVCADVVRVVLAEPKRADMTCAIKRAHPYQGGPACGSVGCFAGWMNLIVFGWAAERGMPIQRAEEMLGPDVDMYTVGRYKNDVFNSGRGDQCDSTEPQTAEHARAVANRIRRFMRINRRALLARTVRQARRAVSTSRYSVIR